MHGIFLALAVSALAIGAAPAVRAHAFLDHASPAVGSSVPTAPAVVILWFTQDLEPAFSNVTVTNEAGQRVDLGMPGFLKTVRPSCKSASSHCRGGPTSSAGTSFRSTPIRRKAPSPSTSAADKRLSRSLEAAMEGFLIAARFVHFTTAILLTGVFAFERFVADPTFRQCSTAPASAPGLCRRLG